MAKSKNQPESSGPTRKEILISRREREKMRQIYLGLGLVGALIVIVLGIGAIQSFVIEPNSTIAAVDGTEIITRDYHTRVNYERYLLDQQFLQLLAQRANVNASGDEQLGQFLIQQYDQLLGQIQQQRSQVDRQVIDTMIDDILVAQEAAARGITVSEEEVDEFINRFVASREGGLTAQSASETEVAREAATGTATLWTPTPTFTPSPTLTATEEITPTATPADTPTPAPTPTLNVLDSEALSTAYNDWITELSDNAGVSEAEYRAIVRSLALADKVEEAISTEVPKVAEQAHARHILVETEDEAKAAIERLNSGESFADVAQELSTDTGSAVNGGDLGFVSAGTFVPSIDEAVFNLPIGEVSEPIESQFGWHVVEVLEREERELSPSDYRRAQQQAYADRLADLRSAATVEDFWTPDKVPKERTNNQLVQPPQQQAVPVAPGG